MSFWETHDLSQWEPLAIKAVTPDGNLFGRRRHQKEESREDEPKNENNNKEQSDFELILNDETVFLDNTEQNNEQDEKLFFIQNFSNNRHKKNELDESEEIFRRVWQEALGLAVYRVTGITAGVQSNFLFPDIPENFLHPILMREACICNPDVIPWLLAFPGGCFASERIS